MTKKLTILIAALALATLGLAACGGDDDSSDTSETTAMTSETTTSDTSEQTTTETTGGAGGTVSFQADPGGALAYTETEATAKAGENTIEFDNPASIPHDVVIEDEGGNEIAKTEVITSSSTSTTANLEKGSYTFYCSIPGHREAGMEGTLTVK